MTTRSEAAADRLVKLGAALFGCILAAMPARPAMAQASSMVCINHAAGYVGRVILENRRSDGGWEEVARRNLTSGENFCRRRELQSATRVPVDGHTGFDWRRTCQTVFEPGRSGTVGIRGTSLHQRCDIW
jgi:hypothetical protein